MKLQVLEVKKGHAAAQAVDGVSHDIRRGILMTGKSFTPAEVVRLLQA